MAQRPVFLPTPPQANRLVHTATVEFTWYPGFAKVQKQRSIASLHDAAADRGMHPLLEISSKSPEVFGVGLSAFNLRVQLPGLRPMTVEAAYQGSKVFENGGPFRDFYEMSGRAIKADDRLKEANRLVGFDLMGRVWPLDPPTAFYDWLYLQALADDPEAGEQLMEYAGFTDIEFNPKRAVNCQARSAALFVSLRKRGWLEEALGDRGVFLQMLAEGKLASAPVKQGQLFGG